MDRREIDRLEQIALSARSHGSGRWTVFKERDGDHIPVEIRDADDTFRERVWHGFGARGVSYARWHIAELTPIRLLGNGLCHEARSRALMSICDEAMYIAKVDPNTVLELIQMIKDRR